MSTRTLRTLVIGAALVAASASVTPLFAQTLGEVAKREEDRRKDIKHPSKVWTNSDLRPAPLPSSPPASATTPDSSGSSAAAPSDKGDAASGKADTKDSAPADSGDKKDQKYWSGRMKSLQAQLDQDQMNADAMQTRINSLTTDFVNRDDPAQRAQIAKDRDRSLAELDRLKKAVENTKKAISNLEEEARRAGVPPGWLRS